MVEFRISTDEKVSKCDKLDIDRLQLHAKVSLNIFNGAKIVSVGSLSIYQIYWSQPG
jgi:hypothetical protein